MAGSAAAQAQQESTQAQAVAEEARQVTATAVAGAARREANASHLAALGRAVEADRDRLAGEATQL
eukprot:8971736-Lingulodinium_polyedra.AAC.1